MATSTNYLWTEPNDSDLVKNGASAIRTLGNAIDASLWSSGFGQAGKNKIINGDFGIWQRGTSFDVSAGYNADRFVTTNTGNTGTITQQTFTPGAAPVAGYEGKYYSRSTITGVAGAGNFTTYAQRIEDVRTFAGQTVTVSYWAKADSAKSVSLEFQQFFGSGGSASVNTFVAKQALTTSWARYTSTIAIPSISGKTIGTGGTQLDFRFWLSAGSTYDSRTSTLGTQSITFDIWGLQVEAGSTATPFQTATGTIQGELAACQRYYFRNTVAGLFEAVSSLGTAKSTTVGQVTVPAPVTMRVVPTSVDYSTVGLYDYVNAILGATSITVDAYSSKQNIIASVLVASGLTQYRPYWLLSNNSSTAYIGFSAEL
jgi:hypothetical protein